MTKTAQARADGEDGTISQDQTRLGESEIALAR